MGRRARVATHPSKGGGARSREGRPRASTVSGVETRAQRLEEQPLWIQVALSALFTFVLFLFGGAAAFVGDAVSDARGGAAFGVVIAFLIVVPFLVHYAYPPRARRWHRFLAYELCVIGGFTLPIPLVYLPWLIVSRRAWQDA